MKKSILIAVLTASIATSAFAQWKPAGDKIKTKWAEQVNPENVLPEYPRPVMERGEIAAVYYIVLAVVVLVMGLRMVRKVDLSKD